MNLKKIVLRPAVERDFGEIVRLNKESEQYTSPMDIQRLTVMHEMAAYHRIVEQDKTVVAFLLAFRDGESYDSVNYVWISQKLKNFLYVDRIVVAQPYQGQQLGHVLYDDLFNYAISKGVDHITCEYNIDPPNERSQRFHNRYGFNEIGSQRVANGEKRVSLQTAKPVAK